MRALYELKEKLCMELEEIAQKPDMGAGDLEIVHKLTDTIKNIDKICMLEEGGHSRAGGYSRAEERRNPDGTWGYHGSYDGGGSYRGRDSMGRYSRAGGYSRHEAKEQMMEQLQEMMASASTEKERQAIQRCMDQMGRE